MTILSPKILILSENDEVAVAVSDIEKGTTLTEYAITTRMAIPRGHKVALKGVAAGDVVRKCSATIHPCLIFTVMHLRI